MHYLRDDDHFATPALHVNSWLDVTPDATLYAFNLMQRNAVNDAGRDQYVIMSPTTHCGSERATEHTMVGAMDVGDARYSYWKLYLDWFDHWLKGVDNGVTRRPRVQYYLTGKNEWRSAPSWPVPGVKETPYYLAGAGEARRGTLSPSPSGTEAAASYLYDPADPFPSKGGTICCTGNPADLPGIFDQSALESRTDLLVYSTDALPQGLTITGPVKLLLYVSSDARDTDFSAKLLDVDPQGHAWNLVNGILRARYRDGFPRPTFMQRDSVYRLEVSLKVAAHYFTPGHRVRVYLTSSDFPMYDRNLNTGGDNVSETTWVKALNVIHQGGGYPSALVLPVVP
jgi:putative CocE/NonD family hydrolase